MEYSKFCEMDICSMYVFNVQKVTTLITIIINFPFLNTPLDDTTFEGITMHSFFHKIFSNMKVYAECFPEYFVATYM